MLLLVFLKEGGPDLTLDHFKELLEPFREDELTNHPGMFDWVEDFAFGWKAKYCIQKKDLILNNYKYTNYDAYYTLESEWIENTFTNDSEKKLFEYFNSVPDDTWLYELILKV